MLKYVLAIAFTPLVYLYAQDQPGNRPFHYLIKDSVEVRKIKNGEFTHPAFEVAANAPYTTFERKNYPIRIAIDPGHFASNKKEALIEDRYINSEHGFFHEAELTIQTALILKESLEKRGFQVMLTRQPGQSALDISFTKWYKRKFKSELKNDLAANRISQDRYNELLHSSQKDVFQKYFKNKEFQARVDKINAFNPDVTLVIHYNASEFENSPERYAPVVNYNYSVCFVPGAFTKQELSIDNQLSDFIRLATTDIIPKSIKLSSYIASEFASKLNSPALLPGKYPELWYLKKYSVYTNTPGVFSRNLSLTRMVNSPVCYGECFLQNNSEEIKLLASKDYSLNGQKISMRVKQVADCWYTGVIKYFSHLGYIQN